MAQMNLFGLPDSGTGSSIFEPLPRHGPYRIPGDPMPMSPAQQSALAFTRGQGRGFRQPGNGLIPNNKGGFDTQDPRQGRLAFKKPPTRAPFFKTALKKGLKSFGGIGVVFEAAFIPVIAAGGAITGAAQWGAPTGLSEDYVGGAVYGGTKGIGAGIGGAVGGIGLGVAGGVLGAMTGPFALFMSPLLAFLGGVAGNFIGESAGGALLNDPARRLGMAAQAISRTSRAVDRIQFGGNFVDSRAAYTMRQHAVQEMSGSMLNARQFLGNEAIFLHER